MPPSDRSDRETSRALPTNRPPLSTGAVNTPEWDGRNRRAEDRRSAPTRPWSSWLTPLRRERGRRVSDLLGYVDRYTRQDAVLLLSIFLLNVGDAFFTLLWLERGGREANPMMDFFLDIGPGAFLAQKCLVVGFWLLILLVHKNFRFARIGLYASLCIYAVLMLIHFFIIAFDIKPPPESDLANAKMIFEEALSDASLASEAPLAGSSAKIEIRPARTVARRVARPTSE
ncbi:MAG: hypothetical protein GY910_18255 [bacterium]|nr:hypothetical protein [Deltaproteobacteria bacterium]MCP4906920.1 hypothetical protein [bacterium]